MKKLVLLGFSLFTWTVTAQTSPLAIHALSQQGLKFTAFDSILVLSDTTASASINARAQYFMQNQHYVLNGRLLGSVDSLTYIAAIQANQIMLYELKMKNSDTVNLYIYYQDQLGRDTAVETVVYSSFPWTSRYIRYFYNNLPQPDSIHNTFYLYPSAPPSASSSKYFYSNTGIDSVWNYSLEDSSVSSKSIFVYDVNGKVRHEDKYAEVNGSLSIFSRQKFMLDPAGHINEIRVYYTEFQTGEQLLLQVVKYLQSGSFSLEDHATSKFSIHPNPVQSRLHIGIDPPSGVTAYEIFNSSGVLVRQGNFQPSLDVASLPTGTYVLRVYSQTFSKSMKFQIVNR